MEDTRRRLSFLAFATFFLLPTLGRAELVFQPAAIDLGDVKSGTLLTQEIKLANSASADAGKLEFKGSCSCLKGWVDNGWNEIAGGRITTVNLRVNTLAAPAGKQHWRLTVRYELRGQPRQSTLDVLANVVPEVIVQPPQIFVSSQSASKHEFKLIDLRSATFQIRKVETSNPHLVAKLAGTKTDDQGREVRVIEMNIGEQLPAGKYDETLTIHTDDPLYRQLKVEVSVTRRPRQRISALPDVLAIVLAPDETMTTRLVSLRDQRGEALEIENVETSDAALSCNWKALNNGQAVALTVTLDRAKMKDGALDGQVRVFFKQPALEKLIIPVKCQLR